MKRRAYKHPLEERDYTVPIVGHENAKALVKKTRETLTRNCHFIRGAFDSEGFIERQQRNEERRKRRKQGREKIRRRKNVVSSPFWCSTDDWREQC